VALTEAVLDIDRSVANMPSTSSWVHSSEHRIRDADALATWVDSDADEARHAQSLLGGLPFAKLIQTDILDALAGARDALLREAEGDDAAYARDRQYLDGVNAARLAGSSLRDSLRAMLARPDLQP